MILQKQPNPDCSWPVRELYLTPAQYRWLLDIHARSLRANAAEYGSYAIMIEFHLMPYIQYQVTLLK